MVLDRLKLDTQCDIKPLAGTSRLYSHFCVDMVNICICLVLDKATILECTLQFAWTALIITLQLWLVSHLSNNFKSIKHIAFFWCGVMSNALLKSRDMSSLFLFSMKLIISSKAEINLAWHDLFLWTHTAFLH